ncbi:transcription factor Opi1-domain-containing protein [Gongronella butleri]|nr:transcription factor Opi1-domain-containing protein [Gongronella butleri]
MHVIRSFLVSLASQSSSQHLSVRADPSVLSAVRKDLVQTLKKVVDVISRYASTSLPYHAKMTVRGFILSLPGRWAVLNDLQSTTTSPAASPMMSTMRDPVVVDDRAPKHEESAMRLLNFGQESVDMLQSVSTVFSDTVDRAHLWIERLRLHPPAQHHDEHIQLPPIHTLDTPLASSLPSSPYTSSPSAYTTAATSTAYASSFHSPSTSSPAVSMH